MAKRSKIFLSKLFSESKSLKRTENVMKTTLIRINHLDIFGVETWGTQQKNGSYRSLCYMY